MQIIRKSALGVVVTLLVSTLFVFSLTFGLLRVFGSAGPVKSALERSGVYESIVEDILKQTRKEQGAAQASQLPLDRPEVQNIIRTAASPELLQTKVENALDSVYAWLHGETPDLTFRIEVGDIRTSLADGIEQQAAQHLSALPVCTVVAADSVVDNPFDATCRPEGSDPSQLAAQAKNQFLGSEFLKDTTISASSIESSSGKTLAQNLESATNAYQAISRSVYGSGILALILAAGVILLSATWRTGTKKVSIILIILGAMSIAVSWVAGVGIDRAAELAKEPLQVSGVKVVEALVGDLRRWWLWYGIALVVIGVATLVVLRLTNKTAGQQHKPDKPTDDVPHKPLAIAPPAEPHPPIPAKQPKPIKKLVQ